VNDISKSQKTVNDSRDALVHYFEKANIHRADAFLIVQAIERLITAKIDEPK